MLTEAVMPQELNRAIEDSLVDGDPVETLDTHRAPPQKPMAALTALVRVASVLHPALGAGPFAHRFAVTLSR